MFSFKSVVGAAVMATVVVSSAFAADTGALAPGKPAGVQKAQVESSTLVIAAGLGAIALGVGLVVSDQNGNKGASSTSATVPTVGNVTP